VYLDISLKEMGQMNPAAQNQAATFMAWFTFGLVAVGGITVWLIPVFVALSRRVPNRGQVIVVDLLLGWTLVGWVVALVMAMAPKPAAFPPPYGVTYR
jgi:4-amino-4-deoxy-L-arabinose transferase-like glycosyltransferase